MVEQIWTNQPIIQQHSFKQHKDRNLICLRSEKGGCKGGHEGGGYKKDL